MSRRSRMRLCRRLRSIVNRTSKAQNEEDMRDLLINLDYVQLVSIQHGWTTWVTVKLFSGEEFIERKFWAVDSLKIIAGQIYRNLITEYLKTITLNKQ